MRAKAVLALEDGSIFHGRAIGAHGQTVGEVVFNTAMTGYQEILTDPSYQQQMVTLTYPHIGNTGTNPEDVESDRVQAAGLIIREVPRDPSNWRSDRGLVGYLEDNGIVGIGDIDTRRLTRLLREKGAQNGAILAGDDIDAQTALEAARGFAGLKGADLAAGAGTSQPYSWDEPTWVGPNDAPRAVAPRFHVAVYDYGIKFNILRQLVDAGAQVTVVPAKTPVDDVLELGADGVLLGNGPGDPEPLDYAIATCRELIERGVPTLGICLGHQILGLAVGAKSLKMKFGHHGANHPVIDVASGEVMISSQNHGFAIDEASLPETVRVTHRSLFDNTLQGIEVIDAPVFSFQGHPEASPGPHDVAPIFARFVQAIEASGQAS
ncbi:glutamine-hydrolyzing carbamoyl-phosphate synthase small subunit [Salinisphaera sp. Q1T1-3]|uniref:glutamine-hydrolyzing carbamoyl-phosphate synthase small subunit n=1 Tax=Salinisphaera sp. Q1T1-3 TaxID=2321229 RepID=UPI000E771873|nr:glutamine-hydrolyzing carbamoyl-phosphate synthase small subunit [Salinisphaera sp. Q1T1-3]RJS92731.1 carbamoyl-phosphate synthase small subunit [Salinisphaera sp. Q1T1-3]